MSIQVATSSLAMSFVARFCSKLCAIDKTHFHNQYCHHTQNIHDTNAVSNDLHLQQEQKWLVHLCTRLCQTIESDESILDNTPQSIAAGVIYYVCLQNNLHHKYTKDAICIACGVSDVTINKCVKKIAAKYSF